MTLDAALPVALAVATALALVAWIWRRPQRGVLLLVGLLPFDGLLILVRVPTAVYAWKEILLVGTLLAAFHPANSAVRASRELGARPLPAWLSPLTLFATAALLTLMWSPPLQGLVGLKVTFFGALTAAVVLRCPLDRRDRDRLVTILLATGTVTAGFGLAQQVIGAPTLHGWGYRYNSVIRFTGGFMRSWSTFNQPFAFAFFLMLVVLVTLPVALGDLRRRRNQLIVAATPLFVAGIAVAVVRTAWIGLAVGVASIAFKRHRVLLRVAPMVIGAVLLAIALGAIGFFHSASAGERVTRWQQLPHVVSSAPLGAGVGSAGAAAAKTETLGGGAVTFDPTRAGNAAHVFEPDNSYLEVLYEDGALGLLLFAATLLLLYGRARSSARMPGADGDFAAGVTAAVLAAAVASIASSFFEIFPMDYLFWLLAGVVSTMPVQDERSTAYDVDTIALPALA